MIPLLAVLFAGLMLLTWRGKVKGAEVGLLTLAGAVLLERIHFTSTLPHPGNMPVLDTYELLIWFPSVYLFAFLLCDKLHALLYSLALLTGSLLLVRNWLIPGADRIYRADVSEFYIGQLGCIVLVYAFALLKERFFTTHELAVDLRSFAETDFLTGVPNRRALTEALKREVTRCERHGDTVGLILLDIDRFKHVNDTLGTRRGRPGAPTRGAPDGPQAPSERPLRPLGRRGVPPHRPEPRARERP